jgi:resuscitation-promoting factor RpfB
MGYIKQSGAAMFHHGIYRRLSILLIIVLAFSMAIFTRARSTEVHAEDARIVTVHIDDEAKTIATNAGTVKEVLDKLNAQIGDEDKTEPALDEAVRGSDFTINVYRARPITVIDGANSYNVMTAERSPKQIAADAGFATNPEDQLQFERSDDPFEGAPGTQMVITRAKAINFDLYGTTSSLRTVQTTVAGLLKERKVKLDPGDELNVPKETRITDGLFVSIAKVGQDMRTVEEDVPFAEERIQDAQQPLSYRQIKSAGKNGKKLVTYQITTKNGQEAGRNKIKEVIVTQPIKQVVIVGAKVEGFSGDFGAALARLRSCEGAYTSNTGNGYYGAYQFNLSTWRSNAPAGYATVLPSDAPPAVQDQAARNLYVARGWQPWPACSRKLGLQDIYR